MAVSKARKEEVKKELIGFLKATGGGDKIEKFREKYPDVSRTTFYRLLKIAREECDKTAARLEIERAGGASALAVKLADDVLPADPIPQEGPQSYQGAVGKVYEVMDHVERVIKSCYHTDGSGRVRNARLLITAAAQMNKSIEVLTKVAERLYDAQRINEMNAEIFEVIREADPETAEKIVFRLQELKVRWGQA